MKKNILTSRLALKKSTSHIFNDQIVISKRYHNLYKYKKQLKWRSKNYKAGMAFRLKINRIGYFGKLWFWFSGK